MRYREWSNINIMRRGYTHKTFYEWLIDNTDYIENVNELEQIRRLFDLNLYLENNRNEFKEVVDAMPFQLKEINMPMLKEALKDDGFIFV